MKIPTIMRNAIGESESLSPNEHHYNKMEWNRLKNLLLWVDVVAALCARGFVQRERERES